MANPMPNLSETAENRALLRRVVDRAGVPYPRLSKWLRWQTTLFDPTESCGIPRTLPNLSQPLRPERN